MSKITKCKIKQDIRNYNYDNVYVSGNKLIYNINGKDKILDLKDVIEIYNYCDKCEYNKSNQSICKNCYTLCDGVVIKTKNNEKFVLDNGSFYIDELNNWVNSHWELVDETRNEQFIYDNYGVLI